VLGVGETLSCSKNSLSLNAKFRNLQISLITHQVHKIFSVTMTEGSWAESPLTVVVAPLVQSNESKSFDSLALFCPAVDFVITSWLEFGPRDIWMCPLSCNNLEDVLLRGIQLCFILQFGRVTLHFHLFHTIGWAPVAPSQGVILMQDIKVPPVTFLAYPAITAGDATALL